MTLITTISNNNIGNLIPSGILKSDGKLKIKGNKAFIIFMFIILNCLIHTTTYAVNYHIAVNGKETGDGSASNPWDIVTGLSGSKGNPGDTLWLRGGVYKGHFVSRVKGSSSANIVVAQYPGEIAILDGNFSSTTSHITLNIYGSYTTYYGFQVMSSDNRRISNNAGSRPTDINTVTGIHVDGPHNKVINLIVRDMVSVGIGLWKAAIGSEVYGCIIYNNGWQGPDRGHGHGIYTQNETGTKLIRDNVIFGGFGRGIQVYGVNGGLQGYDIDGNVIFNSGTLAKTPSWNIIIGGESAADRIMIKNNLIYKPISQSGANIQFHLSGILNGSLGVLNNKIVGGDPLVSLKDWKAVDFSGNTLIGKSKIVDFHANSEYISSYKWNNNNYITPNTSTPFDGLTFDTWKKWYPFDGTSKVSSTTPSNEIIVKPNVYIKGTGSVVVYNHQGLTAVDVDLSKILTIGAEYEIRDVENYNGLPIITGKYNGGTLRIPMNLTTTDKPNGVATAPHSDLGFGVFLVRTTSKTSTSQVISNNPPTLNPITNPAAINEDALAQTVSLSGISAGAGETQTLKVTATSDNISLIPHPIVNYTSPNTTGTLIYTPMANKSGTANITVRVDDGGTSNSVITRTFTVTVNPVNDAPTLNALTNISIAANSSTQTINLAGITAGPFENQKLIVTASSNNTTLIPHPTVVYTSANPTGSILLAPIANQSGTATITVRVTDDGLGASPHQNTFTRTFNVTVGAVVNKLPTLNIINNPAAINEDAPEQTINISGITAGEGESQRLTITAVSDNLTLLPNPTVIYTSPNTTGSLRFQPAANRSGIAKVTVTVNDGAAENNTISRTFTVTINEVNDAPQINVISNLAVSSNSSTQSIALSGINAGPIENQLITITATSNNTALIGNPTITYTSPSTTGTLKFTPAANQTGTAEITVLVKDNGSGTSPHVNTFVRKFFITVAEPTNNQPTLNVINNPAEINEDALEQIINLSGITSGGENQTLVVTATSDNVALIPNPKVSYTNPGTTGSISYRPAINRSGIANITVKVNDGATLNNVITRTFMVKVNEVNDAPTLSALSNISLLTNAPQQTIIVNGITAGPNENQTLTVSATSNNTALVPNPVVEYATPNSAGKLIFTPIANKTGTATITVKVTDNGLNVAPHVNTFTRSFTIVVTENQQTLIAPTVNNINDVENLLEDAALQTIQLTGISAGSGDGKTLKVSATSSNTGIIPDPTIEYTAPNNYGVLKYKPNANKYGQVTITVKVENGSATHNLTTTSFKVSVLPVNDAPTLSAISEVTIARNTEKHIVTLSGITSGPGESQQLSITATSSNTALIPNPGVIYNSPNNSGSLNLFPAPNAIGTTIITVRVTDNGSNTAPNINFIEHTFKVTVSDNVIEPQITKFNLINAVNGTIITSLKNGSVLYTSKLPVPLNHLNIEAESNIAFNGSVVFGFNNNSRYSIENYAPYAIAGNTGPRYHYWNNGLIKGQNTVSATSYSLKGGLGTMGITTSITITIIDDKTTNLTLANVSGLYLVNAKNDEVLVELYDNMVIEESELPVGLDQLNVKAIFESGTTGSVIFGYNDNDRYNVENKAPFLLGGNTMNNASNWSGLSVGNHKIRATPYNSPGGSGKAGKAFSVNFSIVSSSDISAAAPKVMNITRNIEENENYKFKKEDFRTAFVDNRGKKLKSIMITSLPASGTLLIKNKVVVSGEEIEQEEINKLVYIPAANTNKEDVFTWNGSNGTLYANEEASIKLISSIESNNQIKFELAKFWPNPVQENISISFTAPVENSVNIYIYDVKGQLMKTFTSNVNIGNNEIMLNVNDLKGGIYTITLVNHFNKINFRIIKDH